MKIYSKTGDTGKTSALNGQILSKADDLIQLVGTADELNSHLGLVKALLSDEKNRQFIENIQKNIMKLMSHISDVSNGNYFLSADELVLLENEIDRLSAELPEQTQLVVPGRTVPEAQVHIARTVARRTERLFYSVSEHHALCPAAGAYLNRLSDYLFVLSQQVLKL